MEGTEQQLLEMSTIGDTSPAIKQSVHVIAFVNHLSGSGKVCLF